MNASNTVSTVAPGRALPKSAGAMDPVEGAKPFIRVEGTQPVSVAGVRPLAFEREDRVVVDTQSESTAIGPGTLSEPPPELRVARPAATRHPQALLLGAC